ncbi:MAG: hypothetical protein NT077_00755 [Candidatus Taylorbacteria bacterium]|nr:hypothetical protein [Candidatus Taylorbacteria bacterium]
MSRNRSHPHAILSSPITLILALIVLIFLARATAKIYTKASDGAIRLDTARSDLARMENKQADLQNRIQSLSTTEGIEASIREKYHAIEPGELVAVIVNTDTATKTNPIESRPDDSAGLSWWQQFLRVIGL